MTAHTDHRPSLADLATDYARRRDPAALARLRAAVRRSGNYRSDLDVRAQVNPLLARGAHAEVVDLVRGLMPGAFWSPAAHAALAAAFDGLGDTERAARERRTSVLALESVLATGDGTRERPWSVLRLSDEYDVLRARGRRSVRQELVTVHGRRADRHHCDDGTEAWFDLGWLDQVQEPAR